MSNEWQTIQLGEVITLFDNNRIPLSSKERSSMTKRYPYYGATGVIDYVDDFIFDGNYILLGEDGSVIDANEKPFVNKVSGKFWVNNHAHVFQTSNNALLEYIYYSLKNKKVSPYVTGSIQPKISQSNLKKIKILLPPLQEQQKIASVLCVLDDQIELNNKINQELEDFAQTLYNYWFVQFEFPNEEGKPYKSSGGKMVWNEELKRKIPEGWEVKQLGELIFKKRNKVKLKEDWGNERLIDLSNMPSFSMCLNQYELGDKLNSNIFKMNRFDILFGSIRPYLGKAGFAPFDGVLAGTIHSFTTKKNSDYGFVLATVTRKEFFDYAVLRSKGTKMPVVAFEEIEDYTVVIPAEDDLLEIYNQMITPLLKTMSENIETNHTLSQLRDYLLPLLMNGQVTVSDELFQE